ncbi:type I DNA topoisomerase [Gemmatimonadota bacterium]
MEEASSGNPVRALVVVESPAKTKTIEQYLGKGYTVLASMGHVRDLSPKGIPIDIENGTFEPEYVPIDKKKKAIAALRKAAKEADTIFLATDPDREGEAIAWHVAVLLGAKDPFGDPRFQRLTFNEITRAAVTASLEQATTIDLNKIQAQKARRVLDRLVGYKVSPLLWKGLYRGLSAGRVQSVALRLLSEREAEIEAFDAVEYWTLEAVFETEAAGGEVTYEAVLDRVDGKKPVIDTKSDADTLVAGALEQQYRIANVEKKARRRNPPPPFITSTLQQEAARKLGFPARRTMVIAQQLYEGIDIPGEGSVGLITYMRTDSVRIADQALEAARDLIRQEFGADYVPEKPRFYKSGKRAQDAHEAVRPTDLDRSPAKVKGFLDRDQLRLYELIWKRFLACQMNPAELEGTTVLTEGGSYRFKSTGSVVTFPGYLAVYREGTDEENDKGDDDTLPAGLTEGRDALLESLEGEQHFTKPPPRFTDATLIRDLEQNGIGRPSTYAQIIAVLIDRKYAIREKKQLIPTELGRIVCDLVVELFPDIFQVEFTAGMEDELDKIESGQDEFVKVMQEFWSQFSNDLEGATSRIGDILEGIRERLKKRLGITENEVCDGKDGCGGSMSLRYGQYGWFWSCDDYPTCKGTKPVKELVSLEEEETEQYDEKCPECAAEMVVKNGRFGKFLACTRWPDCKGSMPIPLGVDCPECGKPLAKRKSKKGRTFYGCTAYPECEFASWSKPVATRCPTCDYAILVERDTKKEGHHYHCPKCMSVIDPDSL